MAIYPFKSWTGVVDYDDGHDDFYGTWVSGSYMGIFSGERESDGSVDGTWSTYGYAGTFTGTFQDIGGTSMFDVVSGTWTVTSGGTGSGRWWGERTDPEPDW